MIKAVLLDLDHTLYDYNVCNQAGLTDALELFAKHCGKSREDASELFKRARQAVKFDLSGSGASHSRLLYFKRLVEESLGRTDVEFIEKLDEKYWVAYFTHMRLYPFAQDFLDYCRSRKIRIAVVSDFTTLIQFKKLNRLGISGLVDFVVTSEEIGKEKPSPYVFLFALHLLGCNANEAMVVGDDFEKDVLGAKNLGINCIHLDDCAKWRDFKKWFSQV